MSLLQQRRDDNIQTHSAIADGVPAPPIELQRIERIVTVRPAPSHVAVSPQPASATAVNQATEGNQSLTQVAQSSVQTAPRDVETSVQAVSVQAQVFPDAVSRAVEVKIGGNILTRLFSIETTALHQLGVQDVEEFEDQEAELKYQKFTDFLQKASNNPSSPENNPLLHFKRRWIEHDQVLLQPPDPDASPVPYIRFIGLHDENEIRLLHASLSKRKFRREYFPPLRICYVVQQLSSLASDVNAVLPLSNISSTLCGALVTIGQGSDARIVTIGGTVESIGAYYALTVSHQSGDDPSISPETYLSSLDVNEEDYDPDVDSPLVITRDEDASVSTGLSTNTGDDDDNGDSTNFTTSKSTAIGEVKVTGEDWALIKIGNPQLALPNCLHEGGTEGKDDPVVGQVYFDHVASDSQAGYAQIISSRGGLKTVRLLRKPANVRHPSGAWLRTWKAKLGPTTESKLRKGDSGSWVVDVNQGIVYGHIMAATDDYSYIQPLEDIIKDVEAQHKIYLKLASPFGQLADLSKLYFSRGDTKLADEYARRALNHAVLARSSEAPITSTILKRIQHSHVLNIDLLAPVVMRTGKHLGLGLPGLWEEAREGQLGEAERVMSLLADLSETASLWMPPYASKGKQKQVADERDTLELSEERILTNKEKEAIPEQTKVEAFEEDNIFGITERPKGFAAKKLAETLRRSDNRASSSKDAPRRPLFPPPPPPPPTVGVMQLAYVWMLRRLNPPIEMDVTMVGMQNSDKTSLLRVLSGGEFTIDSIPTVGFNMKRIQRGNVTIKMWDIGGQPRFRSYWERYCRGVNCIIFVVDISDVMVMPQAREELHDLMNKPGTRGIPLLVLGNKADQPNRLSVDELIDELHLKEIAGREVSCYGVSAKEETNLDAIVEWLVRHARRKQ